LSRSDSRLDTAGKSRRRLDVLALPRYSAAAPSSRYRFGQFLPALAGSGIDVEVKPLFDDWYMASLRRGERPPLSLLAGAYLGRIGGALARRRPDLLWIEKELLPFLPWQLERALIGGGIPVLLDLDDCQFHRYDQHRWRWVRALLGDKIDRGMAAAGLVTAGSPYIAERAASAGAARIVTLPTAIDLTRYPVAPAPRLSRRDDFVIGWIGTPGNTRYLLELEQPLQRFAREANLRLVVIGGWPGALAGRLAGVAIEYRDWTEAAEIAELQAIDVGIMPLPDQPWERGKCGLKLLQYMASWKPAIASPVGVNTGLVEHGKTGFLAQTADEWLVALRQLSAAPALAQAMGAMGRLRIESDYALEVIAPRLVQLMLDAAGRALDLEAGFVRRGVPDGGAQPSFNSRSISTARNRAGPP
jgi:glycosyltransferase involved in cell wall biosynthesis